MKVLTVMGTRPEAIKMAPVIIALQHCSRIISRVAITAQHRDMLDQTLAVFQISPDYDLDVMRGGQTPLAVLEDTLGRLQTVFDDFTPDWVLVQGDTTSVLAGALSAVYFGSRVGHVEAGLRTYDLRSPFPEEINRVLVDHISNLCFAPTQLAYDALLKEGIPRERIHLTGNTVIDALHHISSQPDQDVPIPMLTDKRLILVTAHRRENHGEPLVSILKAIRELSARPDVHVVYPVHRNPQVWNPVHALLGAIPNVTLLEPLDYIRFVCLLKKAYIVLTDSGGIQEEAPSFGIPVLVLRSVTERSEAVAAGVARLVGTETDNILRETNRLLDDATDYQSMAHAENPFGDGTAGKQIVDILCQTD